MHTRKGLTLLLRPSAGEAKARLLPMPLPLPLPGPIRGLRLMGLPVRPAALLMHAAARFF